MSRDGGRRVGLQCSQRGTGQGFQAKHRPKARVCWTAPELRQGLGLGKGSGWLGGCTGPEAGCGPRRCLLGASQASGSRRAKATWSRRAGGQGSRTTRTSGNCPAAGSGPPGGEAQGVLRLQKPCLLPMRTARSSDGRAAAIPRAQTDAEHSLVLGPAPCPAGLNPVTRHWPGSGRSRCGGLRRTPW